MDGIRDADGDGVGDPECMPVGMVGVDGQVVPPAHGGSSVRRTAGPGAPDR
jgi:hypothetical protein